jgi:hypothetical protein
MYSHVEYFNYSLHALRTLHLTLHESIVAYTKRCVIFQGPFTTSFITQAGCTSSGRRVRHTGQIAHGYTSIFVFLAFTLNKQTHATQRYSTLLYAALRYSMLLYATLCYSTLLYATLRYSTLLYATLRYSTLLYATLRYLNSTLNSSAPFHCARTFQGLLSVRLWTPTILLYTRWDVKYFAFSFPTRPCSWPVQIVLFLCSFYI